LKNFITRLNIGNGPYVLMDAPTPPPPIVPPLPMVPPLPVAPLSLPFSLPLTELMSRVIGAPLGATIPLVIET
jgi:hypothetical protein